jgi:succinate dehydrogenase / fumarate reductase cytochrome b subunit
MIRKIAEQSGIWAFWLHRISGVGIALFLIMHTADTILVLWGESVYNSVVQVFRWPAVQALELVLVATVVYHAVNGLRIILLDMWPGLCKAQAALFWVGVAVMLAIYTPAAFLIIHSMLNR